jgi:ribosome-binding protein aMBF1 (putative translation factor)
MVEIPRGPGPSRFGDWVRAEGCRRGVSADYLAEALGVSVSQLARMNAGRVQWSKSQCRKAEAALVKHEMGMPPRASVNGSGR